MMMDTTDALEIFEEMPHRVKCAVLSHMHSLRGKGYIRFTDYERPVAEYIASSGLLTVRFHDNGVAYFANDLTRAMRPHMRRLLELYGIEF